MEKYKIKYFEKSSQSIKEKKFLSYEEAILWGRNNLENFNTELIQSI